MVNFRDLPQEAQDMLRDLDFDSATMLAIGAGVARREAEHAAFPKDMAEAAKGIGQALRRPFKLELDDPADFAIDVLDVAASALGAPSFDGNDAPPLGALLGLAATALRRHRENVAEARERLWVAKQK